MKTKYDTCESCGAPFDKAVHNQVYCSATCKQDARNVRERVARQYTEYDAQTWEAEERVKLTRSHDNILKNEWILENKTFAMFDIETSSLDASVGEILCACIKPLGKPPINFVGQRDDIVVVDEIRDELEKYDYIVTWYGTGFDIPFLATRLKDLNKRPLRIIRQVDLYYVARSQFKLHSNSLMVAAETFLGKTQKTRILGRRWVAAIRRGDLPDGKEGMEFVLDHCQKDVDDLEQIFNKIIKFKNLSKTQLRTF